MNATTGRIAAIATTVLAVSAFAYVPSSAATQPALPTSSVDSRVIKDGTIQLRDLSQETRFVLSNFQPKNTIKSEQVKNGSLKLEDLSPQLRALILKGCAQK